MAEKVGCIRPTLIAMKGHPGSGKSTLAFEIASALQWPLIDKDDARDCLVMLEAVEPPCKAAILNSVSYEIMWHVAETQLKLGIGVVVDCPLGRPWLFKSAQSLAARHSVELVVVECRAGNEMEWKKRLEARAETGLAEDREEDCQQGTSSTTSTFDYNKHDTKKWGGCDFSLSDLPAIIRWHKPSKWEELQKLINSYHGCWDYDTGSVDKILVDTTAMSKEDACTLVINSLMKD